LELPVEQHHVVYKLRLAGEGAWALLGHLTHQLIFSVLGQEGCALRGRHPQHGQEKLTDNAVNLAGGALGDLALLDWEDKGVERS
jgi:hypothetical protein